MLREVKMSLGVSEGIGSDRCEYESACMCVFVHVCVYVFYSNVAQAYFPGEPNQTWREARKQKDITTAW